MRYLLKGALRMGSEIERQRRKKDQHLARFEPSISSTLGYALPPSHPIATLVAFGDIFSINILA